MYSFLKYNVYVNKINGLESTYINNLISVMIHSFHSFPHSICSSAIIIREIR